MNGKYRAVQATGNGVLELVERPLPTPAAGEVLLAVEACGICHTDAFTVDYGFAGLTYPRVPGHEVIGRITQCGEGIDPRWRVGQRVGVGYLAGRCGQCASCRRGDFINCANQQVTGVHRDGGYAEAMLANQHGLIAIPDDLDSVSAAPLLCAGITTFNALRKSGVKAGQTAAIQGIGGLGHLGIQYARGMGLRTIAIARGGEKQRLALELGAHHYIDSQADDPAQALIALGGADVIIATASNPATFGPLLRGLNPHGSLVIVGVGNDPVSINVGELLAGERSVKGVVTGSPSESETMLDFSLLQNIRAKIETISLEQATEGYAKMMRNEARFRIVITTEKRS
ncbi:MULTISPECIES: zinc-binding dehydrogenase [unclassified Brenneria]|uniref:zinc-binding dehydrogenase n=1 Tax=unclassified Brenneria TaxID=2634434 RepID=UPI0029C5C552|nr:MULTISPECIES: zinc-binding dehydrogenase [unclassified Brenneria]MDX5630224.1 alcohol dehydrogenase catalytic domain-containing protein [Brenneria sp. L3-3Z]MDX5697369.1 alcohol dehydrogenase catalytic domain-containing protein [Brenneria sp. L4-2C]MEE3664682.1 zinc-binding dehydrogenase [Brenneria sp. g21c3]